MVIEVDCIPRVVSMGMPEVLLMGVLLTEGDVPILADKVVLVGLSKAVEMITVVSSTGVLVAVVLKRVSTFVVGIAVISPEDVSSAKKMVEAD